MPQQQRLKWTQLRVGTMVIIGLAILAMGIFFISGQEGFFSKAIYAEGLCLRGRRAAPRRPGQPGRSRRGQRGKDTNLTLP